MLTDGGRTYAGEITRAFGLIASVTHSAARQSQVRHLVNRSSPRFEAKWLKPRPPEFLAAHRRVEGRLSVLSDSDDLDRNRCDLAIVYGQR